MIGHGTGVEMSGVRHDAKHSLRVSHCLLVGERAKRHFWCTCGADFGNKYDAPARRAYRAHRSAS